MPTLDEKLVALEKRCGVLTHAADRLGHLVGRAKCLNRELVLTASQKATLLEHYEDLLTTAGEALANIPPVFADFEPDPTEYESEI